MIETEREVQTQSGQGSLTGPGSGQKSPGLSPLAPTQDIPSYGTGHSPHTLHSHTHRNTHTHLLLEPSYLHFSTARGNFILTDKLIWSLLSHHLNLKHKELISRTNRPLIKFLKYISIFVHIKERPFLLLFCKPAIVHKTLQNSCVKCVRLLSGLLK